MATSRSFTTASAIAGDVWEGLSGSQKTLPPKLFYDAAGSELFERICSLPEYYITRTERAILESNREAIAAAAGAMSSVVELGAGSAVKTALLLHSLRPANGKLCYVPIDVSASALEGASRELLRGDTGWLRVVPVVADYMRELPLARFSGPRLVLYIGSSIGNFEPMQAAALLARVRRALEPGDRMLLGIDLAKPAEVLVPAYSDSQDVTAAFNKNVLVRINHELDGEFDLDSFRHVARWNSTESRIEMHLESTVAQSVHIGALGCSFDFERGETIHTENSYKYTAGMLHALFDTAGLASVQSWTDAQHWFELHMLAPK